MEDTFDNDLLEVLKRKWNLSVQPIFLENFRGFTVTAYKTKGYVVVSAGYTEKAGLDVWLGDRTQQNTCSGGGLWSGFSGSPYGLSTWEMLGPADF